MKNLILACILFFTLIFMSCDDTSKMKQTLMEQEIKIGIEKRIAQRHAECIAVALDSANRIADSIVAAKMTAMDTSLLRRPERPKKPVLTSPLDTTPVKPILPK